MVKYITTRIHDIYPKKFYKENTQNNKKVL